MAHWGMTNTERCLLWRNIAARWKKPQTPFILTSDAFVLDIPQGPADPQTQKNLQQQSWLPGKSQHPNKLIFKGHAELQFEICNTRAGADRKENTGLCFWLPRDSARAGEVSVRSAANIYNQI